MCECYKLFGWQAIIEYGVDNTVTLQNITTDSLTIDDFDCDYSLQHCCSIIAQ